MTLSRPSLRVVLWIALGLVVVASPVWGPFVLRRMRFFRVRRIEIVGAHYVPPSDILARLHVDTLASVWDPTMPLVARVTADAEVERVVIHRKLPGTLVAEVTERAPVALVPAVNGFQVYDAAGRLLPIDPARVTVDAPVMAQRDTTVLRLLGAMRSDMASLYNRVSAVRRDGDEILLTLDSEPVRVMANVSLDRLAQIAPVEADLAHRQLRVAELDLRYHDQVIARLQ